MVFKRYSNPFSLFDGLIETNQFSDFIDTLNDRYIEEFNYDYWLHKIFNKSYPEFKEEIKLSNEAQVGYMNDEDLKTTVNKSKEILSDFKPQ